MTDYGTRARDRVEKQLELRLKKTYTEAQKDILKKLDEFTTKFKAQDTEKRRQLDEGTITPDQYADWVNRRVFVGAQWEEKVKDITDTLTDIREDDLKKIFNSELSVFATNANYQAYKMEHDIGKNFGFDLYDEDAVRNLVEKKPALLPGKIVNPKKHNSWNQGIISNAITQGIIQGESIPKIAARIANDTANHNMRASTMYARTAMTCAQNAGRMEMLRQSKEMGIDVMKKWMSTHDSRTRDSHIRLDGQVQEVEKPFKSILGKIMFPGDPQADPADVYNCRCTLVYVYPEYDELAQYGDYPEAQHMTFDEWIANEEELADLKGIADIDVLNSIVPDDVDVEGIEAIDFKRHTIQPSTRDIIEYISQDDPTDGSCASVAFAYIANKGGYDVLDFRDGDSRVLFGMNSVHEKIANLDGVKSWVIKSKADFDSAHELMDHIETGKEYFLSVGRHSAIVKKTKSGKVRYYDLQRNNSDAKSMLLDDNALRWRFRCNDVHLNDLGEQVETTNVLIDIDTLKNNRDFLSMMRYINTKE